jgi:subtilisin family serine protease
LRHVLLLLFVAVLAAVPGFAAERTLLIQQSPVATPGRALSQAGEFQTLQQQAMSKGRVKVIVGLKVPFAPEGSLAAGERVGQRRDIASAATTLRTRFSDAAQRRSGFRTFSTLPFMALEVSPAELGRLAADPLVISISENRKLRPSLAQSGPLVRAPEAWASGYSGLGQAIAIIDSGVDASHPFLAGKVISEACYSLGQFCPGGATSSVAPGSGAPCPIAEHCAHGTHVAGIAAGRSAETSGIARDASLIAIQVFSPDADDPGEILAWYSDVLSALNRVFELRNSYQIAAVNLSLGSGRFQRSCDTYGPAITAAIANLKSVGIATIAASGNDGWTESINFPACISNAVSVGSVSDEDWGPCFAQGKPTGPDKVACYSNVSAYMSLLAPGSRINSALPGGGYENWHGTSMAAPHVAGAWAVMRQKYPDVPVAELLAALQSSGKLVTDDRGPARQRKIVTRRIDIAAALGKIGRLTFTKAGTGFGAVSITTPRGTTTCNADCSIPVTVGSVVKLTARAASGSRFTSWAGNGCSRTRPCSFTMTGTVSVSATFTAR